MDTVQTPTNKFLPLHDTKQNVVLFAFGAYCPIHWGHISLLEAARKYLDESPFNYKVIGAYVCPTGDGSLKKKLKSEKSKELIIPSKHRVEICNLIISQDTKYDWIMVDGYASSNNLTARDSKSHVVEVVNNFFSSQVHTLKHSSIKVMSVFGADAISKIKSKNAYRDRIICVLNRKVDFDFFQTIEKHPHKEFIYTVIDDNWSDREFSSTKIRERLSRGENVDDITHPVVVSYISNNKHLWS